MEFQLSYFKSYKIMLLKCFTQYASKLGKLSSGHRTVKGQHSLQSQRKAMPKNAQTAIQLHSFHILVRLWSKSFKLGFSSVWTAFVCKLKFVNWVQAGFRKGRGARDQIINICWIMEKAREFQKNIHFCFFTTWKPLTVGITTNCGNFLKRWKYQTALAASWETCMQVKEQQLKVDMGQWAG